MSNKHAVLGLALDDALALLRAQGVEPVVRETCAPRRARQGGMLRVVAASQTGDRLTVARFLDPIGDAVTESPCAQSD